MTTQTLHQGSLRPAATSTHPGLLVHSIAAPDTDRRLSFLVSANIYCALAGVLFLVSRTAPGAIKQLINPDKVVVVELQQPPVEAHLAMAPPPAKIQNVDSHPANIQPVVQPNLPENVDDMPNRLPATFGLNTSPFDPSRPISPGEPPASTVGAGQHDGPSGPVVDVDFRAVRILRQVQPGYPNLARMAHKEGDVVLLMTINTQGVPTDVQMESGDLIFKSDALRAASQWHFTPAMVDGVARSARFKLILQFRLRG